jgi:hypothetical protein
MLKGLLASAGSGLRFPLFTMLVKQLLLCGDPLII